MPWLEIMQSVTLAALVVALVVRFGWLARIRVLGLPLGGSHEPDDDGDAGPDGSRRDTWWMIPYLLGSIVGTANLVSGKRDAALAWIALAIVTFALGRDLAGWIRGRTQRKSAGPASEPS